MIPAMTAFSLGMRYFVGVFAVGFLLGTIRTLWLAPAMGDLTAVAVELPVMIGASWWWGRWLLARQPLDTTGRAIMGGSAFVWLMLAEFGLSQAFGRASGDYLASFFTAEGMLGLAGQLLFAALPLIRKSNRG
jgi:hypothetical protein